MFIRSFVTESKSANHMNCSNALWAIIDIDIIFIHSIDDDNETIKVHWLCDIQNTNVSL